MINYEKQYKQTSKTRYAEDYVDYDPAMTVSQNAYAREDYMQRETTQTKTSTADFEQMIDAASAQSVDLNARDLYPSPTTMQFVGKDRKYIYEDLNDNEVVAVEEEDQTSYKINTKGKVMIAVYALVVLTIFSLIIMNTRLIKNMNNSINEQEARIEILQQENQALYSEYEVVSSDEEVLRRAEAMGMVKE